MNYSYDFPSHNRPVTGHSEELALVLSEVRRFREWVMEGAQNSALLHVSGNRS